MYNNDEAMVMNVIRSVYEDENESDVGLLGPALHEAAGKGNNGTFDILLNPGADVHSADKASKDCSAESSS